MEEIRTPGTRSGDNEDADFVRTVQKVDSGLAIIRRLGAFVFMFVGFGVTIGSVYTTAKSMEKLFDLRATAIEKSVTDFKGEIRGRLDKAGSDSSSAMVEVKTLGVRVTGIEQKDLVRDTEMEQWRAWKKAQEMLQQQQKK